MAAWRALAGDLNVNPWGKAFRWTKKMGAPPNSIQGNLRKPDGTYTETIEGTAELLLKAFVPDEMSAPSSRFHGPLENQADLPSMGSKGLDMADQPQQSARA